MSARTVRVVHGSLDSVDEDVMYLSPAGSHVLPIGAEFASFCKAHPLEDCNFALVDEQHHVADCVRGLPSECNNALLANRRPPVPNQPLLHAVARRSVAEKTLDTLQRAALMVRRTVAYRDEAIGALRTNSVAAMIKLLRRVDWEGIVAPNADDAKQVAFMAAQTVALMDEVELYDKQGLAVHFVQLEHVLRRQSFQGVNAIVSELCERIEKGVRFYQHGPWVLAKLSPPAVLSPETSVCCFEKNRTRLQCFAEEGAEYVRWGNSAGAVLGLEPVDWKPRQKLGPLEEGRTSESYREDGSPMRQAK